jgi:outer membrane protein OmpA-like peptidoglycan-associated protein
MTRDSERTGEESRSEATGTARRRDRSERANTPTRRLQDSAGNQAVKRLYEREELLASLAVGRPDDPLEREAERVAEEVVVESGRPVSADGAEPPSVRPSSRGTATERVDSDVTRQIESLSGSGRALGTRERAYFESAFGRGFGDVRIHEGNDAARAADAIGARAFTYGNDIVFNSGEYSPRTDSGKRLLAHELTHVAQNDTGVGTVRRQETDSDGGENGGMVIEGEVDPEKYALARQTAERIARVIHRKYGDRIDEPGRGIGKEMLAYEVEQIIADVTRNTFAGETSLGVDDAPLLRYHLQQYEERGVTGLTDKLAILRREVGAAKTSNMGSYLGIEPAPSGDYEYEITMTGASGGAGAVGGAFDVTITHTGSSRTDGWTQQYEYEAGGGGASVVPVTAISSSATFTTPDYWSQSDFLGNLEVGGITAGIGVGYSLSVMTIQGDGSNPPVTFDASGQVTMSPNVDASSMVGTLEYPSRTDAPESDEPDPESQPIYQDTDHTDQTKVTFETDSATIRAEQRTAIREFVDEYGDVIQSSDGQVSLVGATSRIGAEGYNRALSERRVESVRAAIESELGKSLPDSKVDEQAVGERVADQAEGTTERSNLRKHRAVWILVSGTRRVRLD